MNDNEYVKLSDIKAISDELKREYRFVGNLHLIAAIGEMISSIGGLPKYQCIKWHPGSEPPPELKRYLCRYTVEGHKNIGCLDYLDYDGHPHWITHGAKMTVIAWADVSTDTEKCL